MRPLVRGGSPRAALLARLFQISLAVGFVLGGFSTGCGACAARGGSGIYVEIPDEIVDLARQAGVASITLKIRIRALDPASVPGSPVLNDLPEQVYLLPPADAAPPRRGERVFEGRNGISVTLDPAEMGPWRDVAAVVHFAVFTDSAEDVRDAFEVIDDPLLISTSCGAASCSHTPLQNLNAIGAYTLTIDRLGRSDDDVVLYPLFFDNVDIDPDGDTMPGSGALSGAQCVAFLEGDYPWNDQPVDACDSIQDIAHLDCDDGAINVNPFEVEPGDVNLGFCVDNIFQNCVRDGPCADFDGDGFPPPEDCNDGDPLSYPGAPELPCDKMDQDCVGGDDCPDCDLDDDGYCPKPLGNYPGGDCCDVAGEPGCMGGIPANVNPGAVEYCGNGIDETCDGNDPPCANPDADGDGSCSASYDCADPLVMGGLDPCAGNTSPGRPICCIVRESIDAAALAACPNFDDCADWDAGIDPTGVEVCGNSLDDDCNPATPDDCLPGDSDGDGFLAPADCGEGNPSVNPDAGEVCGNGIDDDCVGGDVPCSGAVDGDGDTYVVCPVGSTTGCDCDDADATVNPGAGEACNDTDDDCDGVINDGNPEANAGGEPSPCYGNPIGGVGVDSYVEVLSEEWRCRVGATVCAPDGSLTCILFVRPDPGTSCAEDNQCNGRNDVCLPCGTPAGPDLPVGERDLDLDGCVACPGAEDRDGFRVTAGDTCGTGTDCCDDGSEGGPGCSAANASTINTTEPELCTNQTIDNDCNGLGAEICGADAAGDACTTGLPGVCSPGVKSCSATAACSPGTGDSDGGWACGTFCNPSSCPYALAEYCDTIGTDNDCDGVTTDVDDESSAGVFVWQAAPACSPSAWSGACGCPANGACSICATDFYQCTGPAMPTCTPPPSPPAETCDGADTDCDCVGDYTDPDAQSACPGSMQYCAGSACMAGCDTTADCSNGNTCNTSMNQCICGSNPPCTGNTTCNTGTGICECGGSVCDTSGETCNGSMDCACGATTAGSGEACPDSSSTAPDCLAGTGCRCESSLCGAGETCTGVLGDCACGATTASSGEACPNTSTTAPDCLAAVGCRCQTSLCGTNETCTGPGGDCACGATTAGTGEACVDSSAAPDCVSAVGCRCQASLCGPSETCTGPGGDCACSGTTAATGEACPNTGAAPDCVSGSGCRCESSICGTNETCTGPGGDCSCAGTTAPTGEACSNTSAAPDCVAGVGCRCGDALCGPSESCTAPGGDCECGSTTAPTGEACPAGPNPNCLSGACGCDANSTCDSDESCSGGACTCGTTAPATGPACVAGTPNPFCISSACRCDMGSICDADETCSGGNCTCGATAPATGPACPAGANPNCVGGACTCDADSTCDSDEGCSVGECTCGATSPPSGPACLAGTPNPNCVGGTCTCDADSFCDSDEGCALGECTCGTTSPATGPACPAGPNPACVGGACVCDAGSTCDADESCVAGECVCGAISPPTGPACPAGPNPACVGGVCACDANSTCDADESCVSGECTCGTTSPASGPACPAGPNPSCVGGACACDANSICDTDETCSAGSCTCGVDSNASGEACNTPEAPDCGGTECICAAAGVACGPGETCTVSGCACGTDVGGLLEQACPDTDEYSSCFAGGCGCVTGSCTNGFACDTTSHECECNGNPDCPGGGNSCDGVFCVCSAITCSAGQTCDGTSMCSCTGGSCED